MKIEIISGSSRENSLTRRVAIHLKNWILENTPHSVSIIDLKDWDLPHIQHVFVSEEVTPDQFKPLTRRIFEADAFILATPEYNGSYSSNLKNLLDHFPKQHRKPFGIVTASPGPFGGLRAAQQLLSLVPALFGVASPYLLVTPTVDKKFGPSGELLDESFANKVHVFVTEFLWLAEKVVEEKEPLVTRR
jgi:NAD(P)H-dependent FMN reductase